MLIINASEKRCHNQVAHRDEGRNPAGPFVGHSILVFHQRGGILHEGEHGRIEHQTQQSNQPKAAVAHNGLEIGNVERIVFALLCSDLSVELRVHHTEHNISQEAHHQQNQGKEQRCRHAEVLNDERADNHGQSRSQTSHSHLRTHGQSHFITLEPLGNHFGYSDATVLSADSKNSIAQTGYENLCANAENRTGIGSRRNVFHCIVFDECTHNH